MSSKDEKKALKLEELRNKLASVASDLMYLHTPRPRPLIPHRDLKPENVLVERYGADGSRIEVTDYGISTVAPR